MANGQLKVIVEVDGEIEDEAVIGDGPGGYVVICGPGCYVAHEQSFANGTRQITIKPVEKT